MKTCEEVNMALPPTWSNLGKGMGTLHMMLLRERKAPSAWEVVISYRS